VTKSVEPCEGGIRQNNSICTTYIVRENYPTVFRIACMNCNFSLGIRHYCPHQIKGS